MQRLVNAAVARVSEGDGPDPGLDPERVNPVSLEKAFVTTLDMTADEDRLVAGTSLGELLIINPSDGAIIRSSTVFGARVFDVVLFDEGRRAVVIGGDRHASILLLADGSQQPLHGHRGAVYAAAVTPDERSIITGGEDGSLRLFDATAGNLKTSFDGQGGPIRRLALSPDGRLLATISEDAFLRVFAIASGKLRNVFRLRGKPKHSLAWHDEGDRLLVAGHVMLTVHDVRLESLVAEAREWLSTLTGSGDL